LYCKSQDDNILARSNHIAKYHPTYETGPEYQLIDDDGWPDKLEPWQKTGCDYAMHLPNDNKKLNPLLVSGTPAKLFLIMAMQSIG